MGVNNGNKGAYRPIRTIPERHFMDYIDRVIGKKKVIHTRPKKD